MFIAVGEFSGHPNGLSRKTPKQGKTKRIIKQKKFAGQVICACKLDCVEKIDILRQQQIFHDYRNKNWINQLRFLRHIIVGRRNDKENVNPIIPVKRMKFSYNYFLVDDKEQKQEVCHTFVQKLLQIGKEKLFRAAQSMITNPNADNMRGNKQLRAISNIDTQFLKEFIASFPQYESKFNIATTKFLHPRLSLKRVYKLYSEKCTFLDRKAVSLTYFRKIFKGEFTLGFFKSKTPVCQQCRTNRSDINRTIISARRKAELLHNHEKHTNMMTYTINQHQQTVQTAQCLSENIEVLTFSLGNSFDLPYIKTFDNVQKRKLWLHQFCVFDEVRQKYSIYIWPESIASKGSQEIGCCLLRYFHDNLPSETEQLVLYSDPSYGQNRNIKLLLILQMFLQSCPHASLKNIEQRFFLPGHSYNSTDKCFKLIENERKSSEMLLNTSHVIKLVEKVAKHRIVVTEMLKEHFLSTKPLQSLIHSKKYTNADKQIRWSEYEKITHYRDNPFTPKVTKFNSSNQSDLPLKKGEISLDLSNIRLPLLFPIGRYISQRKFEDLQAQLKYFDAEFHSFYKDLKFLHGQKDQDFILSARESSDEEEEFEIHSIAEL